MAGFGSGGWGDVPWGSSLFDAEVVPGDFDIFCFYHSATSMGLIKSDPDVTTVEDALQLDIDSAFDLVFKSGNGISTDTTILYVASTVPSSRTLEFIIQFNSLPPDFSDLATNHAFVGTTSAAGTCAGLFFSTAGIGYVGGVHYAPNLILDSTFQLIPGSNTYVTPGIYWVVRLVINDLTGSVYLYVTKNKDLLITGHVLRAILPTIDAGTLAFPPINSTFLSARGTVLEPTLFRLDELCMSSSVLVANLAPIADAGVDRSSELCSIIQLNGSASFDPEGANLLYRWRLIEAPATSVYSVAGGDGVTYAIDLSGFTTKFHSAYLGTLLDPIEVGDVLLLGADARTISTVGTDGNGFFVAFLAQSVPDNLAGTQFKVLRQRGIYNDDQVVATFLPDVAGFYRFDLTVSDGVLPSTPSIIVVNVLEAVLPRGVVPDVSFVFGLMSDFWTLIEGTERIQTMWSGIGQVVSGELLNLWQHDYSKSLRDIQRQFTRKWLHYDLLLPEPLPELTKVRRIDSSLYSTFISTVSYVGYAYGGSSLTLQVAGRTEPVVLTFSAGAVATGIATLVNDIQIRLQRVDSRFKVRSVESVTASTSCLQVIAPVAVEVLESTMPLLSGDVVFVTGTKAIEPSGASGPDLQESRTGVGIGANTYQVFARLDSLGVVEGDLLCLDGVAYRIAAITNIQESPDRTDIILKDTLPTSPVRAWQISSYVTSELLDFWNGLIAPDDIVFMELAESNAAVPASALLYDLYRTAVVGISELLPSTLPIGLAELPVDLASSSHAVRLAKILRRTYVPVSPLILDVPTVSAKIVVETQADEEAVLRRNVDYFIESVRAGKALHFISGLGGGPDVWEGQDPPDRVWAEFTYVNNAPVIEQNFGIPVDFTLDKLAEIGAELDYLSAVRGLWYSYFNGPTLWNLRVGTQILLGLPFAEEAGTIEEIRTDFSPTLGRILIRDTANSTLVRSYTYPRVLDLETNPATSLGYVVGDIVTQFAPLVEGAAVTDYVKDPKWFEGLVNQGYLREVDKYFRFLVSIDSAAFNLSAFLAVRDFILTIKPTYTYPLVAVISGSERDDEITVSDTVTQVVKLNLFETVCGGLLGASTIFDHYAGDGTVYNQFDSGPPVLWAFDKEWLCPEDVVVGVCTTRYSAPTAIAVGQCFIVGEPVDVLYGYVAVGPTLAVPLTPAFIMVAPDVNEPTNTVNTAGTLTSASIRSFGPMGGFGDVNGVCSLELVIFVNAIEVDSLPFTFIDFNGTAKVTMSIAVVATDIVTVGLRAAVADSVGTYPWAQTQVRVYQEDAIDPWLVGIVLPTGTYATTRVMT